MKHVKERRIAFTFGNDVAKGFYFLHSEEHNHTVHENSGTTYCSLPLKFLIIIDPFVFVDVYNMLGY